jgi:hypothetical protein
VKGGNGERVRGEVIFSLNGEMINPLSRVIHKSLAATYIVGEIHKANAKLKGSASGYYLLLSQDDQDYLRCADLYRVTELKPWTIATTSSA